jgi:hypothetical protein
MDKRKEDEGIHLFIGICLIALGLSILGNVLIEYLAR